MLRLGIAGIGVIANDYIELIATGRVQGIQITALCSRSHNNMVAAVARHGLTEAGLFEEYTAMLTSGQFVASAHEYPGSNRLEISGNQGRLVSNNDCEIEYTALSVDRAAIDPLDDEIIIKR